MSKHHSLKASATAKSETSEANMKLVPPQIANPASSLARGTRYPYDATDEWRNSPPNTPDFTRHDDDWAVIAARGVVADLTDRRGIKQGFNDVDEDVRAEIIQSLAAVIRLAHEKGNEK